MIKLNATRHDRIYTPKNNHCVKKNQNHKTTTNPTASNQFANNPRNIVHIIRTLPVFKYLISAEISPKSDNITAAPLQFMTQELMINSIQQPSTHNLNIHST